MGMWRFVDQIIRSVLYDVMIESRVSTEEQKDNIQGDH